MAGLRVRAGGEDLTGGGLEGRLGIGLGEEQVGGRYNGGRVAGVGLGGRVGGEDLTEERGGGRLEGTVGGGENYYEEIGEARDDCVEGRKGG